jgi:hypothetical protein
MRFMMLLKTARDREEGVRPADAEMERYSRALAKAGVLLADGGPAGFWLVDVRSKEEALEWARRCPTVVPGEPEIEIRPCVEPDE